MMKTHVKTCASMPASLEFGESCLLIFDQKLLKIPGFRMWTQSFAQSYGVKAGESLKALEVFPGHMKKILRLTENLPVSTLQVVAVGGGSVGDFAGFVASVLKRGVDLVHIPSTWLAAIDSAHGGKTALNVGGVKNPIGTFYPASQVYLVRSLLMAQPAARAREGFGELSKIALIDGREWVTRLQRSRLQGAALLWKFLPDAIEAKDRVVRQDPFEKLKIRRVLNLGHTLGHVLEAHYGMAHGLAVGQGLLFSLEWSAQRGLLKESERSRIRAWLERQFDLQPQDQNIKAIPSGRFLRLLKQDKKKDLSTRVSFVFLKSIGRTELQQVTWEEMLREARRQGWVR